MSIARGRWETSLHEAGHLVVWRNLCRYPQTCSAYVRSQGGLARPPKHLTDAEAAIGTAAGNLAAEMLLDRYPIPKQTSVEEIKLPRSTAAEVRQAEGIEHSFEHIRSLDDDDLSVAKACIQFKPDDPADWAERYEHFMTEARAIIENHSTEIRRVAEILFTTGTYTYTGDQDYEQTINS